MSEPINVPVIIIGGGGCGLALSSFLSDYGVEHKLFERHSGTSILPKAHYLNQRTMEIFRLHGMTDEITKKSAPLRAMSQIAWATSLGGNDLLDRRIIHKYGCFGGDDGTTRSQAYVQDAPLRSANLPQVRMEPIFKTMAEGKNPGGVLFSHEVVDFVEEGDSVKVTVKDTGGKETTYCTQYLLAADGGKTVGPRLGVEMEGPTNITDMVSVHFKADLSEYWEDDRFFACHFLNGNCGTVFESGAVVPMGPTWGRHSEEWIFHFGFDLNDEARFHEEKLLPRICQLLKIPDLKMHILKISHWIIERVLANKYRQGRIFILGDAAHRSPPTTGLGLNTGIEDALNIAWKVAAVVNRIADPSILDTYETERRAIGRRNIDWGLFTFQNSTVINAALGLIPGNTKSNKKRFEILFEETERGQTLKAQVQYMIDSQKIEFSAHNIELGFIYHQGLIIPDGTPAPLPDPRGQIYVPTTRPGHRLPHAWLERDDRILSTHDIAGRHGGFALITDDQGETWIAAVKRATSIYGVQINTAIIGSKPHLRDYDDCWERITDTKPGGAILVRPDNIIGWRSVGRSNRDGSELIDAVGNSARAKVSCGYKWSQWY